MTGFGRSAARVASAKARLSRANARRASGLLVLTLVLSFGSPGAAGAEPGVFDEPGQFTWTGPATDPGSVALVITLVGGGGGGGGGHWGGGGGGGGGGRLLDAIPFSTSGAPVTCGVWVGDGGSAGDRGGYTAFAINDVGFGAGGAQSGRRGHPSAVECRLEGLHGEAWKFRLLVYGGHRGLGARLGHPGPVPDGGAYPDGTLGSTGTSGHGCFFLFNPGRTPKRGGAGGEGWDGNWPLRGAGGPGGSGTCSGGAAGAPGAPGMVHIEAVPFPHPELVSDDDGDGIVAGEDNCPTTANADQINRDGDRFGDACDPVDDRDSDSDGLEDVVDLCPRSIGGLEDIDGDRVGDDCDSDRDGDGVFNDDDTCPAVVNGGAAQSADIDDDGTGDGCDADMDGDGVANVADSCPLTLNADQSDADGNGVGDACEPNLHGPVVADDLESLLWHNTDVPVTLTASDESHGVVAILYRIDEGEDVQTVEFPADPDPLRPVETTVTIPAAGNDGAHLLEYFGFDRGGLAGVVGSTTVRIDTIAPLIVAFRTPAGANGWNTGDVTVTFLCSDQDLLSGVARCEPPRTLSADRAGQSVTGVADDRAGNRATTSVTDINIDGTPPTVTCPVTPTFPLGQPGATLVASIGDATSGPVTTEVSAPADTSSVGSKTATVTGEDLAGNRNTRACGYRVDYAFGGFEAPVDDFDANGNPVLNVVKAGRAIPLKWRLTDAAGAPVTTLTSAAITVVDVPCGLSTTVDQIIETTAGDSGLQNFGDGSYQLNWKPPKDYGGSCKRLRLDLGEGNHRTAEFRFVE